MFKQKFIIVKIEVVDGVETHQYWLGGAGILPWTTQKLEAIKKAALWSYPECENLINVQLAPTEANRLNHLGDAYQIEKVFVYEPVV